MCFNHISREQIQYSSKWATLIQSICQYITLEAFSIKPSLLFIFEPFFYFLFLFIVPDRSGRRDTKGNENNFRLLPSGQFNFLF